MRREGREEELASEGREEICEGRNLRGERGEDPAKGEEGEGN